MILTVAIISPATTALKADSVAKVIASSTLLMRSTALAVDHQHAGLRREQIGAAGERALDVDALARDRLGDARGRLVLGHVARLQLRDHDLLTPACVSAAISACADHGAFLEHERALTDALHRDAAESRRPASQAPNFMRLTLSRAARRLAAAAAR